MTNRVTMVDPEIKAQWKNPNPFANKESTNEWKKCEDTAEIFLRLQKIVIHKYAPPGRTKKYMQRRLRNTVFQKRTGLSVSGQWQFHPEYAPSHSAQFEQPFLAKHNTPYISSLEKFSSLQKEIPEMRVPMETMLERVSGFRMGQLGKRLDAELISVLIFFLLYQPNYFSSDCVYKNPLCS